MLCAMAIGAAAGCQDPFTDRLRELEVLHAQGRYDQAAALLDSGDAGKVYGDKNALLYWMDRGAIALARDNPELAVEQLDKAEDFMEVRRESTVADDAARWLINDREATYYAEPYEEQYVNVLKLLAQLEQGNISGGATVEARRMAGKADVLRERYLRSMSAIEERGSRSVRGFSTPTSAAGYANPSGEFIESPLGIFLSAITFMKAGEPEMADVAIRRLATAFQTQQGLIGAVREQDFRSLAEVESADINLLVVALSGRGPTKQPERFGPIQLYTYTVYFELPVLRGGSAEAARARVIIDGGEGGSGGGFTQELALIEDLRAVATENHRRQLPLIQARAYLRSSLKAAAFAIGTEAARRGTSRKETAQVAVEIAGILGGLLFVTQTEKADLRAWTFLPGQAHVGIMKLAPGEHRVRVEYLSATGAVLYSTPERAIAVQDRASALTTVVEHFWR